MKRVFNVVIVLLVLVLAVSCKKNVTAKLGEGLNWNEEQGHYVNEKDAEVKFWHDNEAFAERVVELWDKKYPEVPISYELTTTSENAVKMKLDGPAGLGADVMYMPHNAIVDLRDSGGLMTLPEMDKTKVMNSFQESSYMVAMYESELYGVPAAVENIALAYNKQLTASLPVIASNKLSTAKNLLEQLEREEIYFEDLLKGIAVWGNSFDGAGVTTPFHEERFGDAEDRHSIMAWQLYDAYHNYPLLTRDGYRVFGPDNMDPTQFNVNSKEVLTSVEAITGDWYGNKSDSKFFPGLASIEDIGWDQGPARFQNGQLAITITGPWVMSGVKDNWSEWLKEGMFGITSETQLTDLVGVTDLPFYNNDNHPVTFSGVEIMGVNVYTNYQNAALNLLNFLSSTEIMKEMYNLLGKIPAVKDSSLIPGLSDDPISQGFLKQAKYSHPMPVIQEGNYMWDPLRDVWTNIFNEQMSIKDALDNSQQVFEWTLESSKS